MIKTGDYEGAIVNYEKSIELRPTDAVNYYRAAQAYILNKDIPNGLKYLEQSFQKGYKNMDVIKADKNLDLIRNNAQFISLLDKYFPNL